MIKFLKPNDINCANNKKKPIKCSTLDYEN